MSLIAIALLCMFAIQAVCYWATYRAVQQLTASVRDGAVQQMLASSLAIITMLCLSVSSVVMVLSMNYVHLIFITCGLALIVLVAVANFVSEGGE